MHDLLGCCCSLRSAVNVIFVLLEQRRTHTLLRAATRTAKWTICLYTCGRNGIVSSLPVSWLSVCMHMEGMEQFFITAPDCHPICTMSVQDPFKIHSHAVSFEQALMVCVEHENFLNTYCTCLVW